MRHFKKTDLHQFKVKLIKFIGSLKQVKFYKKHPLFFFCAVICLLLILSFNITDKYWPVNVTRARNYSALILSHENTILTALLAKDEKWRFPIKIEEIDPLFIQMLLCYEDKRFYYHKGVDPIALMRAAWQWLTKGYVVSGGSSITMQTARLLEPKTHASKKPWPKRRSFSRKLLEIFRALQLEVHFSKREILEFYLSLAPYGGNLEGLRAATLAYLGKEPIRLTAAEAALMVVMPQSPNRLRPELNWQQAKKSRDKVLQRMCQKGVLTAKQTAEAMEVPVPSLKRLFPRNALHVAYHLQPTTQSKFIPTYLNHKLQLQIEDFVKQEIPFLTEGQSMAVLLVENTSRRVLALVGSVDFFNENRKGQINMVKAIRSPGSLLKPFIYGLGFEEGFIHPDTIIQDVPTSFSGYQPSNFQETFHGAVSIREALKHSYNIPAVAVLERLGPGRFFSQLKSLGVTLKFEQDIVNPSLPLALGGVGMNLWDLVSLYVALANNGIYLPLILTPAEEKFAAQKKQAGHYPLKMLEKNAVLVLKQILEETNAPEGFVDPDIIHLNKIAYKTGTSYGYRDAWAIGFTKDYTVGVWVGKPDGTTSSPNTGRNTAAPRLFKIFNFLPNAGKSFAQEKPQGMLGLSLDELPESLVAFKSKTKNLTEKEHNFRIRFPQEGATLHWQKDNPIMLHLCGGEPPYHFFVNGRKVVETLDATQIVWKPTAQGFTELMVIDNKGRSNSITVLLH